MFCILHLAQKARGQRSNKLTKSAAIRDEKYVFPCVSVGVRRNLSFCMSATQHLYTMTAWQLLIGCTGTDSNNNKSLLALCPHRVWLFLHQGQQHLPAQLHCSHGSTSKQQPDRQKLEMQRGRKQGCDTFYPVTHSFPLTLGAEAQSGTWCVGAVFGKLKLQSSEPATQAAQTAHSRCLFPHRPYIF